MFEIYLSEDLEVYESGFEKKIGKPLIFELDTIRIKWYEKECWSARSKHEEDLKTIMEIMEKFDFQWMKDLCEGANELSKSEWFY